MDASVFAEVAEAQKPFIETPETKASYLGVMTRERWATLIAQLQGLGDLKQAPAAQDCFRQL
jgi:NitT/TauT family transport system substrate-binding protein